MNLLKSSLFSLLAIASLVIPQASFAADEGTLTATVNIEDAKIVSQQDNVFDISFKLTNREGLQTGVKYGVELVPEAGGYIADQMVYSESLTLYENSAVSKEVAYTAPKELSGTYNLFVMSNSETGFPFGVASLGKVKLVSSVKGVHIDNSSCYLQAGRDVKGTNVTEKGNPHYALDKNVDINPTEVLTLTCTGTNASDAATTLTPFYETRAYGAFGPISEQVGGSYAPVAFAKGEKKTFSTALPRVIAPGMYAFKFALMNADMTSNSVSFDYIVNGVTARIEKISLDQDHYGLGDSGNLSILWSATSGNYARSNLAHAQVPALTLAAKITNKNNVACAAPVSQALAFDATNPITTIPLAIKANCTDPHVSATLTDKAGHVLDQKDFTFTTNPSGTGHSPLSLRVIVIGILAILVLLMIGLFIRRKSNAPIQQA